MNFYTSCFDLSIMTTIKNNTKIKLINRLEKLLEILTPIGEPIDTPIPKETAIGIIINPWRG